MLIALWGIFFLQSLLYRISKVILEKTYFSITLTAVVLLLSHLGEYIANGLANANRRLLTMIARVSPDIR